MKEGPKLFQNLRASRETELVKRWPAHVAAEWMGHSQLIAAKHYLQIRDEDYEEACKPGGKALQSAAGRSRMALSPSPLREMTRCYDPIHMNKWAMQDSNTPCKTGRI